MHNLGHSLAMNIEAEYDVVKLIDALVTNKATHIKGALGNQWLCWCKKSKLTLISI